MRVELAAAELDVPERVQSVIRAFVQGVPFDDGDVDINVAASVTLRRTTWRAAGPTASLIAPMTDFFDLVGTDIERQAALTEFGLDVQPTRLGHWLQTRDEHLDAGWYVPVEMPLNDALRFTPASTSRDIFEAWCQDEDIEFVEGFERSLGPADYGGLWIELPGRGPTARVAAAEDLMDDLAIGRLPDVIRGILTANDSATLVTSIWLIAEGVARFAVGVLEPDPSLLIALSMALGTKEDDRLARVQGALNADGPSYVEAVLYADTVDVEASWDLALSG